MDITQITDVKELKSMAYDQMVTLEQAQENLRLINRRIAEINEKPPGTGDRISDGVHLD